LELKAAILFFLGAGRLNFSELFEIALVLVRFNNVARFMKTRITA
jgi:hypothetical protein